MLTLDFNGLSETGRRKNNQDSLLCKQYGESLWVFAVADGMGGAAGGEICSQLVIKSTEEYLDSIFSTTNQPEDLKGLIAIAFDLSQKAVSNKIKENPELQGMGTTFTIMVVSGAKFAIGHIGDSRLYLLRNNNLYQLTQDQTQAQHYLETYGDQADPNILKQYANVLMKCLDGNNDIPDFLPEDGDYWEVLPSDRFVICSDGLIIDKMGDSETYIKKIISSNIISLNMCEQLIETALSNGSQDNITVVCINEISIKKNAGVTQKINIPNKKYKKVKRVTFALLLTLFIIISFNLITNNKNSIELDNIGHENERFLRNIQIE